VTELLPTEKSYLWDKLDEIFEEQRAFKIQIDSKFKGHHFSCYNIPQDNYDLLDDITNIIEEAIETRRLIVPRKKWSKKIEPIDRKKILEELIDINKFTIQAMIRLGYGAPDMYKAHKEKTEENKRRQENNY
jgi:hypothetical protein